MDRAKYLIVALLLLAINTSAQQPLNTNPEFYIQGRMIAGEAVIKIIPGNQAAWFLGMKNGYKVSISQFEEGDFSEYEMIIDNLRPAAKSEFNDTGLPREYANAMRKMIYEESYALPGNSFDDMLAADKNMSRLYFSFLLFSSYDPVLSEMSGLQTKLPKKTNTRFKIKVEINNYTKYTTEQILLKKHFYSKAESPHYNIIQGDKKATLEWNHTNYKKLFVAYAIERSENGKEFNQIGPPIIFNSLSDAGRLGMILKNDSLPENYKNYWYHVRGFDAFGILSEPEEAHLIQGKDMTAPESPARVNIEQTATNLVTVSWTHSPTQDLEGFQVIGASSEKGKYNLLHEQLLPPTQTTFNYDISKVLYRYYRVLAVDTARNAAASTLGYLVVYDTIPPAIPTNIEVTVDSNHVATIKWPHSKDEDIKGYRVFKAYHPTHGFIPITPTPITDTLLIDSLSNKRLDKRIYYQVVALDDHFNHSQPSVYVSAIIPDFIAPTKPLLMKAELNAEGQAYLEWYLSSSSDVASYTVIRRIKNDTIYQILDTTRFDTNKFTDVSFGTLKVSFAEYYIQATDSSGNVSGYSNGKRVIKKPASQLSEISKIIVGDIGNMVEINWVYSSEKEYSVLIYRAEEEKAYSLIDRVKDQTIYVDMNVKSGKRYSYKLGILESTGKRSPLSEETTIKLK